MSKINRNLGNLLMCIAELVIGILLLMDPVGFTNSIIVLLGVLLIVVGAKEIFCYFRDDPETASQNSSLAKGLLFAGGGLFCILKSEWFFAAFPLLSTFYGVLILLSAISKLQWAVDLLRKRQRYWFVTLIGALLSLAFAVIVLANPFATTATLWMFVAISLIVEAVADIVSFIFGRK